MKVYKFGYIVIFVVFLSISGLVKAAGDSTSVTPPTVTAVQPPGYILGQGSRQTYCNPNDDGGRNNYGNCGTFTVSNTHCPAGFTPRVSVAVVNTNYAWGCNFQRITIDGPNDGPPNFNFVPYDNGRGGYDWQFWQAYTRFQAPCDDKNITLHWMAVCVK